MRIGVKRTAAGLFGCPDVLVDVVQAVESLGYHSYWLGDHIFFPERIASIHPGDPWPTDPEEAWLETLGTMGFLFGRTVRLPIGADSMIAPYRNPLLAAKTLATLDHLSRGRVRLALGAGWIEEVFAPLGAPPFAARGRALDEYVAVLRQIWQQERPAHEGEFFAFPPSHFHPGPHEGRRIAIMIGGNSGAARRRAVRIGDGWSAPRLGSEDVARGIEDLRTRAGEAGRDPATLEVSVISNLRYLDRPDSSDMLMGTPDGILEAAIAYRDAGVTEIHANPIGDSPAEAIASLARFRHEAGGVDGLSFAG